MSGVYAYCVLGSGHRPPDGLVGLDDGVVRALDVGPLTVWLSDVDGPPAADLLAIGRHDDVVRSASRAGAAAPLRFGAWAPDEAALRHRIDESRASIESTLQTVADCVEMGIRVVRADEVPSGIPEPDGGEAFATGRAAAGTGRAYLRALAGAHAARLRRREAQDALARRLAEALSPLVRAHRLSYLAPPEVVALAHLVRVGDESEYRRRVEESAARQGGAVELHVTGPWPPYSFAS